MGQKDPQAAVFSALIFDTDVAIWMLRRHPEAVQLARSFAQSERLLCVISYLELLRGCRDAHELKGLVELAEDWFTEVIALTPEVSDRATALMKQFPLSRRPGVNDGLIAATAIYRQEALTTGNVRHFDFIGREIQLTGQRSECIL